MVLVAALMGTILVPAEAVQASAQVLEQHWELTSEPILPNHPVVGGTYSSHPIGRGIVLGDAQLFEPAPTVTFEVVARVTGGISPAGWRVELRALSGPVAEVVFTGADSAYTLKHATVVLPSSAVGVNEIRLAPVVGAAAPGSPGVIEVTKAYLKLKQTGPIIRTTAQFALSGKQLVTGATFKPLNESASFSYNSADWAPRPLSARLWLRGRVEEGNGMLRLWEPGGSVDLVVPDGSTSRALTLATGSYTLHAKTGSSGIPWELVSADIYVTQFSPQAAGIVRTVSRYILNGYGADLLADEVDLGMTFRAPENQVSSQTLTWLGALSPTGVSQDTALRLRNWTSGAVLATAYVSQIPGEWGAVSQAVPPLGSGDRIGLAARLDALQTGRAAVTGLQAVIVVRPGDTVVPTVQNLTAFPALFGGSGKALTSITATLSEPSFWAVSVRGQTGGEGRRFEGIGSVVDVVWDGTFGVFQGKYDATYEIVVLATDVSNNTGSASTAVEYDGSAAGITGFAPAQWFSPDGDGVLETTSLGATFSEPVTWTIGIARPQAHPFRRFTGVGSSESVIWDGTDEMGAATPDGSYVVGIATTDEAGNDSYRQEYVTIDRAKPALGLPTATPYTFNPTSFQSTTIAVPVSEALPYSWTMQIRNSANLLVRSFSGSTGTIAPVWNGRNESSIIVPDGIYTATVIVTDSAGNTSSTSTTTRVQAAAGQIPSFQAAPTLFSPNGDGLLDTTTFNASLGASSTWTLTIHPCSTCAAGKSFTGNGTSISQVWNGEDDQGNPMGDLTFTVKLVAVDQFNSESRAELVARADSTGPYVSSFWASPSAISPNADGVQETTSIGASLSDSWGVDHWDLAISSSGGGIVRSYSGLTSSVAVTWDGKNQAGSPVAQGDYTATLTAYDGGGNTSQSLTTITVDSLAPSIINPRFQPNAFSPNGDGIQDITTFKATMADPTSMTWEVVIRQGDWIIKTYLGTGDGINADWDGRDSWGVHVPDGVYVAGLTVWDRAGNVSVASASVTLERDFV